MLVSQKQARVSGCLWVSLRLLLAFVVAGSGLGAEIVSGRLASRGLSRTCLLSAAATASFPMRRRPFRLHRGNTRHRGPASRALGPPKVLAPKVPQDERNDAIALQSTAEPSCWRLPRTNFSRGIFPQQHLLGVLERCYGRAEDMSVRPIFSLDCLTGEKFWVASDVAVWPFGPGKRDCEGTHKPFLEIRLRSSKAGDPEALFKRLCSSALRGPRRPLTGSRCGQTGARNDRDEFRPLLSATLQSVGTSGNRSVLTEGTGYTVQGHRSRVRDPDIQFEALQLLSALRLLGSTGFLGRSSSFGGKDGGLSPFPTFQRSVAQDRRARQVARRSPPVHSWTQASSRDVSLQLVLPLFCVHCDVLSPFGTWLLWVRDAVGLMKFPHHLVWSRVCSPLLLPCKPLTLPYS